MFIKVVVENDEVTVRKIRKLPVDCEWMMKNKFSKDRQHLGKSTYTILRSEKQNKKGEDLDDKRRKKTNDGSNG